MRLHSDGTVKGTPEELAAYALAKQRLIDIGKQTVPAPLPYPDPWPNVPFDSSRLCDTCRAKVARGEMAVCGCVLSGPQVTC